MKVAHLCCVIPPAGGMGTVALHEVSGLRSRGIEATLFAPESKQESVTPPFVKLVSTAWHLGNASWLKNIRSLVAGYDVLHIHWPFFGTADRLMLRTQGLPPIVVTFHMDAEAAGLEAVPIVAERLLVQPLLFTRAKKILVSSFDYASSSSIKNLLHNEPARFVELPFGVDLDRYAPGPETRGRFALPDGARSVLFVGGLDKAHSFKGVNVLLEAMTKLADAHLLIVGDGDVRPSYEEQARKLGIERRTHFLGRIDDTSLVDAYRTADVLAFPSTNRAEAFGLVPLEAQACGLPVVASNLPGFRQVVRANETGLLVRPGSVPELASALERVVTDDVLHERLSKTAITHAQGFSWEKHLDGLVDVYRQVCASRS